LHTCSSALDQVNVANKTKGAAEPYL